VKVRRVRGPGSATRVLTDVMRRPERWFDGAPEASKTVPGIWSHLLTCLGASHACIGFRFSLLECVPPRPPRAPC
jgi:hypothetical protein